MVPAGDSAARLPYAACWHGNVAALAGRHGVLSTHASVKAARKACVRQRDALARFWGAYKPWFAYRVIDRRSGEILHTIH